MSVECIPHWLQSISCSDSYGHLHQKIFPHISSSKLPILYKSQRLLYLWDKHHIYMRIQSRLQLASQIQTETLSQPRSYFVSDTLPMINHWALCFIVLISFYLFYYGSRKPSLKTWNSNTSRQSSLWKFSFSMHLFFLPMKT